eukprot:1158172-Pelagomonas_calceolata.AAC.2
MFAPTTRVRPFHPPKLPAGFCFSVARPSCSPWQDEKAAAGYFGFPVTNTIGGTIQPNPWTKDWVEFFREHRLGYMLRLAGKGGCAGTGKCEGGH